MIVGHKEGRSVGNSNGDKEGKSLGNSDGNSKGKGETEGIWDGGKGGNTYRMEIRANPPPDAPVLVSSTELASEAPVPMGPPQGLTFAQLGHQIGSGIGVRSSDLVGDHYLIGFFVSPYIFIDRTV